MSHSEGPTAIIARCRLGNELSISRSQYSRIERGLSPHLSIDLAVRLFAVLGHDLSIRPYPTGDPIRDTGHAALLNRLRSACHPLIRCATEVPLPLPGDLRAWDATAVWPACRIGVEAETRLRDLQAQERRLSLKQRDGGMDRVILLVSDSRSNRDTVRRHADWAAERFPVPGRRALELLGAAVDPGGDSLILLCDGPAGVRGPGRGATARPGCIGRATRPGVSSISV